MILLLLVGAVGSPSDPDRCGMFGLWYGRPLLPCFILFSFFSFRFRFFSFPSSLGALSGSYRALQIALVPTARMRPSYSLFVSVTSSATVTSSSTYYRRSVVRQKAQAYRMQQRRLWQHDAGQKHARRKGRAQRCQRSSDSRRHKAVVG